VLVRIRASTVNRSDAHNRAGRPFISRLFHGLRRPKGRSPGSEFAGEVAEVGAAVTEFEVGDRVFGVYPFFGVEAGAHAEFMCIPERAPVVHMPEGMEFEEAAAVPDGAILALGCGETYRVIFDAVGKHSYRRCRRSLEPGGLYTPTDGFANLFWAAWTWKLGDSSVVLEIPPHYRKQDLLLLKQLLEEGRYRAVIDRRYPLEDVIEATRYVETQQKTGNVVLTVAPSD
jgi:NADPH:quinone reductase-like Zn-dependent oxidoreductase